jgi:hypothetical protein
MYVGYDIRSMMLNVRIIAGFDLLLILIERVAFGGFE